MASVVLEPRGYKQSIYFFKKHPDRGGIDRLKKMSAAGLYRLTDHGEAELIDSLMDYTPSLYSAYTPFSFMKADDKMAAPAVTATANALYFQQGTDLVRWIRPGQLERIPLPFPSLFPFRQVDYLPDQTASVLECAKGLFIVGGAPTYAPKLYFAAKISR